MLNLATEPVQISFSDVQLSSLSYNKKIAHLLPEFIARKHNVVSLFQFGNYIVVALSTQNESHALELIEAHLQHSVCPIYCSKKTLLSLINAIYTGPHYTSLHSPTNPAFLSPVGLAELLNTAYYNHATAIHIEPYQEAIRVRIQFHKKHTSTTTLPIETGKKLILEINNMMDTRTATISHVINNAPHSCSVSSLDTSAGKKLILKPINTPQLTDATPPTVSAENEKKLTQLLSKRTGLILLLGAHSPEKKEFFYSCLSRYSTTENTIISLEKKIDRPCSFMNQLCLSSSIQHHFNAFIQTVLKQEPDLLAIDDITCFSSTSSILSTILTNQLLVASLDCQSINDALLQLANLGIPAALLETCCIGTITVLSFPALCPACKEKQRPETLSIEANHAYLQLQSEFACATTFTAPGCDQCSHSGKQENPIVCINVSTTPPNQAHHIMSQKHALFHVSNGSLSLTESILKT